MITLFVHRWNKTWNVITEIITPGVQLTPLLSTGFPHSSLSAMAMFGLVTFSNNNRTLCYYCITGLCLPFGHEIRERSSGLWLGFVYLFHVADCALGFRKFCMQCTRDFKWGPGLIVDIWLFYCTAPTSIQLMRCTAVNKCCKVNLSNDEARWVSLLLILL